MLLQHPNGQQKQYNDIIHLCPPLFHLHYRTSKHAFMILIQIFEIVSAL